MKPKVAKFGGTSLASADGFRQVRRLLSSDPMRRIAVVSAPGKRWDGDEKMTDLLLEGKFDRAFSRFEELADALRLQPPARPDEEFLRDRDRAVSRGEAVCAQLLAGYMGWKFVDAKDLILFDREGKLCLEETLSRLKRALSDGEKMVLPGFYGAREDGSICTFPRGGSDITGALAAAALGAQVYENWTDVCGVRLADPKLLKDAPRVEKMNYRQLRALGQAGAQVVHHSAVQPVEAFHIPMHIRCTFRPEAGGTWVDAEGGGADGLIAMAGRAAQEGSALLTLVGFFPARQVSMIFSRLDRAGLSPVSAAVQPGQEVMTLAFASQDQLASAVQALAVR